MAPSAADLYGRGEGFFLDFPGSALDPGCLYEQDFDRYTGTVTGEREPAVYAHVATQDDEPDKLAVQYWFYWYFNDWNNKHESDWEGIQLLFDVGTVDEALKTEPVSTGYAQHEGGERADWDSTEADTRGRPPGRVPIGRVARQLLRIGAVHRSQCQRRFRLRHDRRAVAPDRPEVILLPRTVAGPDDHVRLARLRRSLGERQSGPFNGPTGPQDKERWTNPSTGTTSCGQQRRRASRRQPGRLDHQLVLQRSSRPDRGR